MLVFILYLFLAIGLLMLISAVAIYSVAVLVAPFMNLYSAIKQKDYKLLSAVIFALVSFTFLGWVITL